MSTINQQKLTRSSSFAAGTSQTFKWFIPWNTTLNFWALPVPPSASGPHGTSTGRVQITKIQVTHVRDNYNEDQQFVEIDVKNTGSGPTQFDMWMSWIS